MRHKREEQRGSERSGGTPHRLLPVLAVAALALLPMARSQAQPVLGITSSASKHGAPGDYVTVPFTAVGNGSFRFAVSVPVGWAALTPSFTQQVGGPTVLLVTVRVGENADPSLPYQVTVTAFQGDQRIASASRPVKVDRKAGVSLRAPERVQSLPGEAHSFDVLVENDGNFQDSYAVTATGTGFGATISPRSVTLAPGASTTVRVSVAPTGSVSNGYTQAIRVSAASAWNGNVSDTQIVYDVYFNPALPNLFALSHLHGPQLVLGVDTALSGTLTLGDHPLQGSFSYSVAPSLQGSLSDFVNGSFAMSALTGTQSQVAPSVPTLSIGFAGDSWSATADLGLTGLQLLGTDKTGFWSLDGGTSYRWSDGGFGVQLTADRQSSTSDLTLSGSLSRAPFQGGAYGNDSVSETYTQSLGQGLSAEVGVHVLGLLQPGGDYLVLPQLTEQLTWQNQHLNALESYSGQPTLGLHQLTLAGGMRSLAPVGVRTTNVLNLYPGALYTADTKVGLFGSVSLSPRYIAGQPIASLSFSLLGDANFGTATTAKQQFTVSPTISLGYDLPGSIVSYVSVGYQHMGGLGLPVASDLYRASISAIYGNFSAYAYGSYQDSVDATGAVDVWKSDLKLGFDGSYTPWKDTSFGVNYAYVEGFVPALGDIEPEDSGNVSWKQQWTIGLSTTLEYALDLYPHASQLSTNSLTLTADYAPASLPSLQLSASYGIHSPFGIYNGTGLSQTLTFNVGYALALPFDTPRSLVEAFGGRKTGLVEGTAYQSAPAGGAIKPLAGLEIKLGKTSITTAADGSFSARVPVGSYSIAFGKGMPATVGYFGTKTVDVKRNETVKLDLRFQPVGSMNVVLFDDANHNGVQDSGEQGIPFGGVRLQGPIDRSVVVGDAGKATVADLPAGRYHVSPDPGRLPKDYVATGAPVTLELAPGARNVSVAVGAALPAPTVVTTFQQGQLSLYVQTSPQSVVAGAELSFDVNTGGKADSVTAEMLGSTLSLQNKNGAWTGKIRVPLDTPIGPLTATVRATSGSKAVSQNVVVAVVGGSAFQAPIYSFQVGTTDQLAVQTLFHARTVELKLSNGTDLQLKSSDGYHWSAAWTAPSKPDTITVTVIGDGQTLGTVQLYVTPPKPATNG
jgi:hypothetical protein